MQAVSKEIAAIKNFKIAGWQNHYWAMHFVNLQVGFLRVKRLEITNIALLF